MLYEQAIFCATHNYMGITNNKLVCALVYFSRGECGKARLYKLFSEFGSDYVYVCVGAIF